MVSHEGWTLLKLASSIEISFFSNDASITNFAGQNYIFIFDHFLKMSNASCLLEFFKVFRKKEVHFYFKAVAI